LYKLVHIFEIKCTFSRLKIQRQINFANIKRVIHEDGSRTARIFRQIFEHEANFLEGGNLISYPESIKEKVSPTFSSPGLALGLAWPLLQRLSRHEMCGKMRGNWTCWTKKYILHLQQSVHMKSQNMFPFKEWHPLMHSLPSFSSLLSAKNINTHTHTCSHAKNQFSRALPKSDISYIFHGLVFFPSFLFFSPQGRTCYFWWKGQGRKMTSKKGGSCHWQQIKMGLAKPSISCCAFSF